jgi:hypothetical protein
MSIAKAKAYYAGKNGIKKLNCAQAVIAAFGDKFNIDGNTVDLFASFGAGRAPAGECGALYAAKFMLKEDHPERTEECKNIFVSKAGSTRCKEIRKLRKLPCIGCVETIAKFIEDVSSKNTPGETCNDMMLQNPWGISLERQIRVIAGCLVVIGILAAWLVHRAFIGLSLFVGCGLIYAGITDNCMMGILLMKLPYNRKLYKTT